MANTRTEILFPNIPNEWITQSGKLVTLRTSDYQDVKQGTVLKAKTDDANMPIVIVRNEHQSLGSLHPGVLLGDGFQTAPEAAQALTRFSRNGNVSEDSFVHALFFLHQKKMNSFPKDTRQLLLNPNISMSDLFDFRDTRQNKKNEAIRELLFRSFYFWLIEFHNIDIEQYPQELANRDIISASLIGPMQKLFEQATKTLSQSVLQELTFQYMLAKPDVS